MILRMRPKVFDVIALWAVCLVCMGLPAQEVGEQNGSTNRRLSVEAPGDAPGRVTRRTATIHWRDVPLGDAVARLKPLFAETIFVDRRVDPNLRVNLDIAASSAEQVVAALAAEKGLGACRLGKLIYLGPSGSAEQLKSLAALRMKDVSRLPADLRTGLAGKRALRWPRLGEPRQIVNSAVQTAGWRVGNSEQIPHDLWAAGEMPELSLAEQLTVLLIGFDRTFAIVPNERTIEIIPLAAPAAPATPAATQNRSPEKTNAARPARGKKQVYTLRVQEKPVGAVLRELAQRLEWTVQIDEEAIRAAGKSLDTRVSFSVENADRDKLLDALLTPAGLEYKIDGEQIRVRPQRYGDK